MKKLFYILAVASVAVVSCNKNVIDTPVDTPATTGKTITFSASIDMPAATKASLDGLNIKWSSSDYIGICTDNDATIVAYPVTVDGSDATICTITVNEVAGATAYYGIFRGSNSNVASDDFSGITFNTSTKTFSGLNVGSHVSQGAFSSHLYYSNGFPLTMAGKADGTSLVMKPCLALVKVQVHSDSVPADHYIVSETYNNPTYNVNHDHSYSAVRGFLFSQRGSSTVYSQGDFTVQVSDSNDLTVTPAGNNVEERELGGESKMVANAPYYMCIIPGGTISSFRFRFWGYADDAGTVSWTPAYVMNLSSNVTVSPGSFFDLGTLNPLGRKMAKNHAADDADDKEAAEAASFVPAIDIDGSYSDWTSPKTGVTIYNVVGSGKYQELKVTYDKKYIYFYSRRNYDTALWTGGGYYYYQWDKNNDGNYDFAFYSYMFANTTPYSFPPTPDGNMTIGGSKTFTTNCAGSYDADAGFVETELSVLRSSVGISNGDELLIDSYGNKSLPHLTMSSSITIAD